MNKYIHTKEIPYHFVYEYCPNCNRIMQFEIDEKQCILCGSDHPYGLIKSHGLINNDIYSQEEWDEYYLNNTETTTVCPIEKRGNY